MFAFPRTLDECLSLDAAQIRDLFDHAPETDRLAPYCTFCRAGRGQPCTAASGNPCQFHAERQTMVDMMTRFGFPLPDEVTCTCTTSRSTRTRSLMTRITVTHPRLIGRLYVTAPRAFPVDRKVALGCAWTGGASWREVFLPGTLAGQVLGSAMYAPDRTVAARLVGITLSDAASARFPEATLAQEVFTLVSGSSANTAALVASMTPDGRYTLSGVTEPYPGAWPRPEVACAVLYNDLTTLWPYMGG